MLPLGTPRDLPPHFGQIGCSTNTPWCRAPGTCSHVLFSKLTGLWDLYQSLIDLVPVSLWFTCGCPVKVQVWVREGLASRAQFCRNVSPWVPLGGLLLSLPCSLSLGTSFLHMSWAREPCCSWSQKISIFSPLQLEGRGCRPQGAHPPKWGRFPILTPSFSIQAATGSRRSDCPPAHSARPSPTFWTSQHPQPSCCSKSWPCWPQKRLRDRGWRPCAR